MTNRISRFTLGSAFMIAACSAGQTTVGLSGGAKPPWDSSPLQTDSLVYHLRRSPSEYSAYVTAVYRNMGIRPVYFARCNGTSTGPMFGLRRTGPDSTRRFFTDWAWACVGGVPTGTIQPGDSVVVRVRVGSVDQPAMQPPLQPGDLIGDLRIDLALCVRPSSDSDFCSAPPQNQRSSNAFNVRY
jgi:hypothetical protein